MVKITTLTEAAAGQKLCHLTQQPHQGNCCGSQCMAWQWGQAGRFTCSTKLLPRYAESAFEGYREDEVHELPDFETANFYQPIGDGWQFNTFDAGEDGWEAHWERDTDPEREGYCAALNHPMAVVAKLDEISTAIGEGVGE
jgi:hypothetical protein